MLPLSRIQQGNPEKKRSLGRAWNNRGVQGKSSYPCGGHCPKHEATKLGELKIVKGHEKS